MKLTQAILKWHRSQLLRIYFDDEISNTPDTFDICCFVKLAYILQCVYDQQHDRQRIQKLLVWAQRQNSKSIIVLLKRRKRKSKKVLYSLAKTVISLFIDNCWLKGDYRSEFDFLTMLFNTSDVVLDMHDYVYSLQLLLADGFYENASYKLWFAIKRSHQVIAKDRQNTITQDLNMLIRDIIKISFLPISDHPSSILFWNKFCRHILTIPFFMSSLDSESFKIIQNQEIYFYLSHQLMDYTAIMYTQSGEESLFFLSNLGVYSVRHMQSKDDDIANQEYMERIFLPISLLLIQHCRGFLRDQKTNPRCLFHHFFKWYEGYSLQLDDREVTELYADVASLWSEKIIQPTFALIESVGRLTTIDRAKKSKYSLRRQSIGNLKAKSPDFSKRFSFRSLRRSSLPSLAKEQSLVSNHQLHDYDQCSYFPNLLVILRNQAASITSTIAHSQQCLNIIWKIIRQSFELCNEDINFLVSATARESKDYPLNIFSLFCDCGTILFSTLDDHEIYENEFPFKLQELDEIRTFLNIYCLLLCQKPARIKSEFAKSLFQSAKKFLMVLEEMNANRRFFNTDPKSKLCVSWGDLTNKIKKGHLESLCILHDMPHCIPFEHRVEIFRMYVQNDKESVNARRLKKPLKIRRDHILEDGFKQISKLTDAQVKLVVKIEFINTFGLKEAGIDQNGVFKEFLEETCKHAFDQNINLFQSATNGTFCISPSSSFHENHLQIFFFIGRILGKALYDGIVLDIPLSRFIFAKFLGRYNYFEDLPFLDAELYKNLIFLKHYSGDINDLSLTFKIDEDVFGNIVTKEIKYGGANIPVTKENRFEYIYLMADYKLNRQCHAQYDAFIRGFRSIISSQWLQLFSPRELEKLMSGQNESFDLNDLKPFVHYEGGYSESSSTIRHLWEVLNEFNAQDKALFLKFVTSCSRPPVGGFKYLSPPFTIRLQSDDKPGFWKSVQVLAGLRKDIKRLPSR